MEQVIEQEEIASNLGRFRLDIRKNIFTERAIKPLSVSRACIPPAHQAHRAAAVYSAESQLLFQGTDTPSEFHSLEITSCCIALGGFVSQSSWLLSCTEWSILFSPPKFVMWFHPPIAPPLWLYPIGRGPVPPLPFPGLKTSCHFLFGLFSLPSHLEATINSGTISHGRKSLLWSFAFVLVGISPSPEVQS